MVGFGKIALLTLGLVFSLSGFCFADSPSWILKSEASMSARVARVDANTSAYIVVLDSGTRNKLVPGMVCDVYREKARVAKVVLVESLSDRSAGLIISGDDVKAGDIAIAVPTL